jgi:glycosyltransferase involved in cell wall biosynthesis
VPRLVGAADLAILTSLSEGVPLSLIEAMAAELPVVATKVGGVPEVVVDGQTGLLASAGDDATLADLVLELAADPARRDRLGREGRERAYAVFSEDRMVAEYDRVYRELVGRPVGVEMVGA